MLRQCAIILKLKIMINTTQNYVANVIHASPYYASPCPTFIIIMADHQDFHKFYLYKVKHKEKDDITDHSYSKHEDKEINEDALMANLETKLKTKITIMNAH